MYYNKKIFDKAAEQFKKAVENSPKSAMAHYNLANVYREMKMYDEAIEEYNITASINPVDYKTYFDMGVTYKNQNSYDRAASSFEKSLQINASQVEAHEELGMIYYRNLKNNQKAIYHFEKVLSMKPNHPDADKINSILNLLKGNK